MQNSSKLSFMSFYHKHIKCFTETTTELEKLRKNYPEFHVNTHKSTPPSLSLKHSLHKIHVQHQFSSHFHGHSQYHVQPSNLGLKISLCEALVSGRVLLYKQGPGSQTESQNKAACGTDILVINPEGKRK